MIKEIGFFPLPNRNGESINESNGWNDLMEKDKWYFGISFFYSEVGVKILVW